MSVHIAQMFLPWFRIYVMRRRVTCEMGSKQTWFFIAILHNLPDQLNCTIFRYDDANYGRHNRCYALSRNFRANFGELINFNELRFDASSGLDRSCKIHRHPHSAETGPADEAMEGDRISDRIGPFRASRARGCLWPRGHRGGAS